MYLCVIVANIDFSSGGNTISMETSDTESASEPLPIPVRSHTAHVIGNKMVTLFGLSSGRTVLLSYVQEFDFGELSLLNICTLAVMLDYLRCSNGKLLHHVNKI